VADLLSESREVSKLFAFRLERKSRLAANREVVVDPLHE
jgi:hypothetical protein